MLSLIACFFIPNIDDNFMSLIEIKNFGSSQFSEKAIRERFELVYRKWSKYVYITFIEDKKTGCIASYYNGFFIWTYPKNTFTGKEYRKANENKIFPYFLLDDNAKVAIIGAGGGKQV